MIKRWRILLLLALTAVAAGLVLCSPRGPREPVYQGQPLHAWLPGYRLVSPERREEVQKILRAVGAEALPWLMSEFTRKEPKWRVAFRRWMEKITRSPSRAAEERARIWRAAAALELLGPAITPALPELSRHLDDPELGANAAIIMAEAGELALPYFTNRSNPASAAGQLSAVHGLEKLARHTEAAVPPLVQALQSTNDTVRQFVANSFSMVRLRPDLTVPALTRALADPQPRMRSAAAGALGNQGASARAAIPELLRLMTNSDARTARIMSNNVRRIDPAALPPRGP